MKNNVIKKRILMFIIIFFPLFGSFIYYYAAAQSNQRVARYWTSRNGLINQAKYFTESMINAEARSNIQSADSVLYGNENGGVFLTPGIYNAENGEQQNSGKVVVFGGAGQDLIEMEPLVTYARGGEGNDYFLLQSNQIENGKTKIIRGDGGWDTAILSNSFSIENVLKRTSPYKVIDPNTGGIYEIDVETLSIMENLKPNEVSTFPHELPEKYQSSLASIGYTSSSANHYATLQSSISSADIFPYEKRISAIQERKNQQSENSNNLLNRSILNSFKKHNEDLSTIPLSSTKNDLIASPFGGYPAIFSIENGFLAVSSDNPLEETILRNSIVSATISVSASSLADSKVRVRLLTETEFTLRGDLADPLAVEDILSQLKNSGILLSYRYTFDRCIEIVDKNGIEFKFKPTLFVMRTGLILDKPLVEVFPNTNSKLAFSVIGYDGFAQTFVEIPKNSEKKKNKKPNPFQLGLQQGILKNLKNDLTIGQEINPTTLIPQPTSKITLYPAKDENQYPFMAEIDGGILFLTSETPIQSNMLNSPLESVTISISNLFFTRKSAQLFALNGDQIIASSSIMNPSSLISKLEEIEKLGKISSFRLVENRVDSLNIGFTSGKYAKMVPTLFGSRSGLKLSETIITTIDDNKNRFSFSTIGKDGVSQPAVDIGGLNILPAGQRS